MPRARFVAGRPADCMEPIPELAAGAEGLGVQQTSFARLGRDYASVIRFLSDGIVPRLS